MQTESLDPIKKALIYSFIETSFAKHWHVLAHEVKITKVNGDILHVYRSKMLFLYWFRNIHRYF